MKLSKSILILTIALFLGHSASANAQYKLYAGFMYHFAKYTQWPAAKQTGDFVIGVIGSSDMAAATKALASTKKVGNRRIVVKTFSSAAEAKNCHILFVGKTSEIAKANALSKTNNFLVITEAATTKGSTINFVEASGRIQFELSQSTVSSQGLKISSELQKLAIIKS